MTYRIKNWQENFENHESRKVKGVRWVAMPNKHDGKGYRRIAQHPRGVELFCAWTLLLQVASKMPERGVLADEDGPLDADDLSAMTGFPAEIFELAFQALTEPKIAWLEVAGGTAEAGGSPAFSRDFPESPGIGGNFRLEGNGREGNGTPPGGGGDPPPTDVPLVDDDTGKEAVRLYRQITGRQPKPGQRDEIRSEVHNLVAWEEVLRRRTLANKDPSRVDWILEDYRAALPPPDLPPEVFDDPHLQAQRDDITAKKRQFMARVNDGQTKQVGTG